ncbi:BREX-1 system adenine-specific DNA-methyltransferase PglX [Tepidanaerobacter sp. EBM-38]|uniref:BREX-1 system adenine-specific DNA-methyltransferase PglX n=1 Tax=Tepidanaerobacter sp. EBM-38 TaxID=1918496 RepID=UPI000B285092|nr:BREX-1 system adenine-specific DNA-methyltransferase PglX [Tepidanaerobacter sp. EBM-38]
MDKSLIKNYAVWARNKLIEDISQRAYELGITENEIKKPEEVSQDYIRINGKKLKSFEINQRKSLEAKIREKGFEQVVEEVAYTWFNRIIALRFMEVNGYIPTGVRVLSSAEPGKTEPDIITYAEHIDLDLNQEVVARLKDENDTEELFRYLLVKQCNKLNDILPGLFEKIGDYTDILLPKNLLSEGSIIRRLVSDIPEEYFKEQVEIIGWLYQYYISEKKDEVFAGLKKNQKITKEKIPAATQLFTPKWIVKYMVENSLGRLWLEKISGQEIVGSGKWVVDSKKLKEKWKYYIDEAEQEPEVEEQLKKIRAESKDMKPEDIKVLDPAMGSGHILVYAFDVLFDIYKSAGYSEREIPKLILENNLYGLDIDDRAGQLAYFAVMMKARSKNRRIFRENIDINLCSIQESNGIPEETITYFAGGKKFISKTELEEKIKDKDDLSDADFEIQARYLIHVFQDAKEYGSILEVKKLDFDKTENRLEEIRQNHPGDAFEFGHKQILLEKLPPLIKQAKIMSSKYDVVVTNPPYMGRKGMNENLKKYIDKHYSSVKSDLFSVFIERSYKYTEKNGHLGFMSPFVWMFISSYEELRKKMIKSKAITSLIQLEYSGFDGATVPICTFTLRNSNTGETGEYIRLSDFRGAENQSARTLEAIQNPDVDYRYTSSSTDFSKIPGSPIAYWVSERIREVFNESIPLGRIAEPRQGMATSDNNRFLRLWFEVSCAKIGFGFKDCKQAAKSKLKWFPYNKGGEFRKWYGNNEFVVNWENNGAEIRNFEKSVIRNENYYFRRGLTWSALSSGKLSMRFCKEGHLFDSKGPMCFICSEQDEPLLLAYFNSIICEILLKILAPTLDFNQGPLRKLPIIKDYTHKELINKLVQQNISISKTDWDSFETSWDFKKHPILTHKGDANTIEKAFDNWAEFAERQFYQLKANEEELNRIFIKIYGLEDELTPEVDEKDVTVSKADRERDIKSFISYAVGCMFGRYSPDVEGLVYAGGEWSDKWKIENGQWKVRKLVKDEDNDILEDTWIDATFAPESDNTIPITDEEYFEDDIVARFIEFLKVTFGEEKLEENLDYIAESIGKRKSETSRQALRRYFLKDFYKNHVQTYKQRPIYWLFDSGRQDGFKALIYMHRYDEHIAARVRIDYLHKLQRKYEDEIKRLDVIIDSNLSLREKNNARKAKEKLQKQIQECLEYDQVIAHVANQRIKIDLDDGVIVNYAKFQGIEIPQGEGKKPLKANLLAKI